jgi:hypothetical protein
MSEVSFDEGCRLGFCAKHHSWSRFVRPQDVSKCKWKEQVLKSDICMLDRMFAWGTTSSREAVGLFPQ